MRYVKVPQHMQRELAQIHYMLVYVEGPDVVCVKHLLLVEWRAPELPAAFPT